ncbi:MAG: class I SAM-dependent methyltransferase [Lachnospiraceae bacterium]|nr:class I SAM-dependent methyltransferase [Lachnospiraceae bacterium]
MDSHLFNDNAGYWANRAYGYSVVNQEELSGIQHLTWSEFLSERIDDHFPGRTRESIKILDIGCGPGFISIILTEQGYSVTAADLTEEMLEHARYNAGTLRGRISFETQNAQDLSFEDGTFDVVFSRNLTWNLPEPEKAYSEWMRVLKRDGLLLVFDANWYNYLRDDELKNAYDEDRANVNAADFEDYNIGADFDKMEDIARQLPLTGESRPLWDIELLRSMGASKASFIENVGDILYSEKEKVNYRSTPMFMVEAVK